MQIYSYNLGLLGAMARGESDKALTVMTMETWNGLDSVKAAFGLIGKGCKNCHEAFRAPKDSLTI